MDSNGGQQYRPYLTRHVVGTVGDKFVGESVEEITVAGKGVFNSFLKAVTALGRKESKPNYKDCPEKFLMFYYYDNLN